MTPISIIIPTQNAGPGFADLLARLKAQRLDCRSELIIIDSGSTDATVARARAAGARVEIIEPAAFNHGTTRNRAIALAHGKIVVLLSQDALPKDDGLIATLAGNFIDPQVAGAFARHEARPRHDPVIRRHVAAFSGSPLRRESHITDPLAYGRLTPAERFAFCRFDNVCSAIRRGAWQAIPFAARDFAEDLDWSRRVLEAGWKIIYDPAAAVIHSHALSLKNHYLRSYHTHRALGELFSLRVIPTLRELARQLWLQIPADLTCQWRDYPHSLKQCRRVAAAPLRTVCPLLAAYRAGHGAAARAFRTPGRSLPTPFYPQALPGTAPRSRNFNIHPLP